jgi:hypothetical protein
MPINEASIYKTEIKCCLKQCLNYNKGICELVRPFGKRLTPNHITCVFFDDNFSKSWDSYKQHGGTISALIRMKKGLADDAEVNVKKTKGRRPRKDKGQKREPKTNLDEIM